jgi:hypothetical protein
MLTHREIGNPHIAGEKRRITFQTCRFFRFSLFKIFIKDLAFYWPGLFLCLDLTIFFKPHIKRTHASDEKPESYLHQ